MNRWISCQTKTSSTLWPCMQESDFSPFPFTKIAVDICGPYPKTLSGNQYTITFIDIYNG